MKRTFSLALVCALLSLSLANVPAQTASSACSCNDAEDLMNRYNEAQAAIREYRNQIAGVEAKEKADGSPLMFTSDLYKGKVQPRVQEAINAVTNPNARRGSAETFADCKTEMTNVPTACLREVFDAHEGVHRRACEKAKTFNPFEKSWSEKMRLADFLREEIEAYTVEIEKILQMLRVLDKKCLPKNWFGTVRASRVLKDKTRTIEEVGDWLLPQEQSAGAPFNASMPDLSNLPQAQQDQLKAVFEAQQQMQEQLKTQMGMYSEQIGAAAAVNIERRLYENRDTINDCCVELDRASKANINFRETELGSARTKGEIALRFYGDGLNAIDLAANEIDGYRERETEFVTTECKSDKNSKEEDQVKLQLQIPNLHFDAPLAVKDDGRMLTFEGSKTVKKGAETFVYTWLLKRFK